MTTTNCCMTEVRLIREMDRLWFRLESRTDEPEDADAYVFAKAELDRLMSELDAVVECCERLAA